MSIPTGSNGQENSQLADIGVVGLAVMGQNLILNLNDHGYKVCAYNRTVSKVHAFLENEAKGTAIVGADSLEDMVAKLKSPRKVLLMVKAGDAVDEFIDNLMPILSAGDVIIDGGNSNYVDSNRRCKRIEAAGLKFVGCGVSGGEEGARYGPSMMPGGSEEAWPLLKEMFQAIAAKTANGEVCCDWVGPEGSGHFVKMVHNGIEYGDMQLIAEAYALMRDGLGMESEAIAEVFQDWNRDELNSFLIEITGEILKYRDAKGQIVADRILDKAGQKGTGKWTVMAALDTGMPVTLIAEAVFARALSAMKEQRVELNKLLPSVDSRPSLTDAERQQIIQNIRQALYASKIISYAQGFLLLKQAAHDFGWSQLNYAGVALMWKGGCIIRSTFLSDIQAAFTVTDNKLSSLLHAPFFIKALTGCQAGWRSTIQYAVGSGIAVPAFSSALAFYDGCRTAKSPANLIQAQRDYFGAHTFEIEGSEGTAVHVNWTGRGGNVTAGTYQA